jgi:hypothetical protein
MPQQGLWTIVDNTSGILGGLSAQQQAKIFPLKYNRFGLYVVRLAALSTPIEVVIDDYLPLQS